MKPHTMILLSRITLAIAALVAMLAMGGLLRETHYAGVEQSPVATLTPAIAAPGEVVTLQGNGWPPNAQLSANLYEASNLNGASSSIAGAIQTDASGSFSAKGAVPNSLFGQGSRGTLTVVPGSYTVVISAGTDVSTSLPFTVGAPHQGAMLWGQVYLDTNNSGTIDPGDVPASGLVGISVTGPNQGSPTAQAITDARGRYMLYPVGPGSYSMSTTTRRLSMDWAGSVAATAVSGQAVRADILLRPAPLNVAPERYFSETGFAIQNDAFWDYFSHRGGIRTLGFPISRTFLFQGYSTQFFQRVVLQEVPGQGIQRLNLLDPGLMPYTRINGSQFPPVDPSIKAATPVPGTADYDTRVIDFVRQHSPNDAGGTQTGFFDAFMGTVTAADAFPEGGGADLVPLLNLEVWGTPTSNPTADPTNSNFVYLRFQRGIMHFQGLDAAGNPITEGILLGDWFKSLITGDNLPVDLESQAKADNSPYLRQYDPSKPGWIVDPSRLRDTDFTFAFVKQQMGQ